MRATQTFGSNLFCSVFTVATQSCFRTYFAGVKEICNATKEVRDIRSHFQFDRAFWHAVVSFTTQIIVVLSIFFGNLGELRIEIDSGRLQQQRLVYGSAVTCGLLFRIWQQLLGMPVQSMFGTSSAGHNACRAPVFFAGLKLSDLLFECASQ